MRSLTHQPSSFFSSLQSKIRNPSFVAFAQKQLDRILQSNLIHDLENSKLTIPSNVGRVIKLKKQPIIDEEEVLNDEQILRMIEDDKQMVREELRRLQEREDKIKLKSRIRDFRGQPKQRSSLSKQDKQKLRRIIKEGKQKEILLEQKGKEFQQTLMEKSSEELKKIREEKEDFKNRRRQAILKKLKSVEFKKSSKQCKKQKEKEQIIYKKKYLYKEYEQAYEKAVHQEEIKYEKVLESIKERKKFDIGLINQHSQKCDKIRQQASESKEKTFQTYQRKSYNNNLYRMIAKRKFEEEKVQQQNKIKYINSMKEKVLQYQNYVRDKVKPKVTKQSKFCTEKQEKSPRYFSDSDRRVKGKEYLEIAKKMKDFQKQKQRRHSQIPIKTESYKNYLGEIRAQKYVTDEERFRQITRRERSLGDLESANRVILLAEKIEGKGRQSKDEQMYHSVKNKLEILNALQ